MPTDQDSDHVRSETRYWMPGALAGALAVGCGAPPDPMAETGGANTGQSMSHGTTTPDLPTGISTGMDASSGSSGPDGTSTTTGSTSNGGSSSSGHDFIVGDDTPPPECDVYAQDCPRGEKCAPYSDDGGGAWNNVKCVPVMEDPAQVGEPCFVIDNGVSGIDNCELGASCWDTNAENEGTCVGLCTGSPEAPMCASGFYCAITGDGVLNLCLGLCDPLAPDCDPTEVCIANPSGEGFVCILDASGEEGQAHEPCEFANACDPGLLCVDSNAAEECDPQASGCCEPFCDLTAPNSCPGVGQVCTPYFEMGQAPAGSEDVGYCAVPM